MSPPTDLAAAAPAPRKLPSEEAVSRLLRAALVIGVLGLLVWLISSLLEPQRALGAYLAAYTAAVSVALGALALLMIGHLVRVRFITALRTQLEAVAATLPFFAFLFLPIATGLDILYPWVPPLDGISDSARETIAARRNYLNVPFFLVRALLYFATWTILSVLLRRWSLLSRGNARPMLMARQRALSAVGLIALAFTTSFAAFDWLMSLSPEWHSTIYGIYYLAGSLVAALASTAVMAWLSLRNSPSLPVPQSHDLVHSIGELLLTFIVFWAYIAFSQLLIIWIGNLPADITWYIPRLRGSWGAVGLFLVAGRFALPFLLLLSRDIKRSPTALAALGAWLLLMHFVDAYWLVLPELQPAGANLHLADPAALAALAGTFTAAAAWLFRRTIRG